MNQTGILIVDDEPSIRKFVCAALRSEGYEVTEASDGEEAIWAVEKVSPDLILLDILMPKMNGYDACRRIRERSLVPIIMLSALGDPLDKVLSLHNGADDHMSKPFMVNELLARISAVLLRSFGAPSLGTS